MPDQPERRVHDLANETLFETCCKIIDPSIKLSWMGPWWEASWNNGRAGAGAWHTKQEAWRECFNILDRRRTQQSPGAD